MRPLLETGLALAHGTREWDAVGDEGAASIRSEQSNRAAVAKSSSEMLAAGTTLRSVRPPGYHMPMWVYRSQRFIGDGEPCRTRADQLTFLRCSMA